MTTIADNAWPWPLTCDLDFFLDLDLDVWPWSWYITTFMLWRKHCKKNKCLTSRDAKTVRHSWYRRQHSRSVFLQEHSAPNQKFLRLPVPKLWLKRWFSWLSICLTLTLTFRGHLTFENSPCVPLHDWCKYRSYMFINSGDTAHWNMENSLYFIMGIFRCHGNVCYFYLIAAIFCKLHQIGPSNMCINFENNRLTIEHFISWFPFFINSSVSQR